MEFKHLRDAVSTQLARLMKHSVFKVAFPVGEDGAHLDQLYNLYLDSFPPGTNEIYRKQREYECSCCRSFIRAVGGMVAVIDGKLETVWDVTVKKEPGFQPVVDVMAGYIHTLPIGNVFTHFQSAVGQEKSFETVVNGDKKDVRTWNHFSAQLPSTLVMKEDGPFRSEKKATYDVFIRGMREITLEAIDEVGDLIATKGIYKHAETKGPLALFRAEKVAFDKLPDERSKELAAWIRTQVLPASISRLGNTSFGELLYALSEGTDLDVAVKAYEKMVAPENYKRTTALVTPKQVAAAKATVAEMGLTSALSRRFATLNDLTINNILFVDRSAKSKLSGEDPFDTLAASISSKVKVSDQIDEVSIEHFIAEVLPRVESIEVLLENRHAVNFVSLIAPDDATAGRFFKWNNKYSWSYTNDVTDAIKERVKAAGGNVSGDLCCRLSWFNYDDLDLHMMEPDGYHIQFINKGRASPSGGTLDVDMNMGGGSSHRGTREPVENIFYTDRSKMKEGNYSLFVNNYARVEHQDVGFQIDFDWLGTISSFHYEKAVKTGENVNVVTFKYTRKDGIEILTSLPSSSKSAPSQTLWALPSQTFHKVNVLLLSPNHWDDQAAGNKHFFFMLQGAVNDGKARGFYNEFLREDLNVHRKVFEMVGSKMRFEGKESNEQLSGLGFSSTQKNSVTLRVKGQFTRTLKVNFNA